MKKLFLVLVLILVVSVSLLSTSAKAQWTPDWDDFFPGFDNMLDCSGIDCSDYANSCQDYVTAPFPSCCIISNKPVGTSCGMMMECNATADCVTVINIPVPVPCNDSNACTTGDIDLGLGSGCQGTPITCDDSNPSTTDTCNPATGCVYTPIISPPDNCDDGNACTTDIDVGMCMNIPITCNDNNSLTTDTCNPATGCVYTPIVQSCDDGNACTSNDHEVQFMGCQGTPITCNDNNSLTTDTCNPATGCVYTPICTPSTEVCDGADNDCNGVIDDNLTAPLSVYQVGVCLGSHMVCMGASGWLDVPPATEICDNLDNDCDGIIDEDLTGPLCSLQSGVCLGSRMSCNGANGWQACTADTYSAFSTDYETSELTCDGLDNDCNGQTDEESTCIAPTVCGDGFIEGTEECDDGDTNNQDGCSSVCLIEDGWNCTGIPSNCTVTCIPEIEIYDLQDNDCDGLIDELPPNPLEYYTKTELGSTWPIFGSSLIGFSGTWVNSSVQDALEWLHTAIVGLQTQIDNIELTPGPAGPQGETGLPGEKGDKGDKGDTGSQGEIGPQGPPGKDGLNGTNGIDGINGTNGIDGKDGADGATGPQGEIGPQGPQGEIGPQGPPGTAKFTMNYYTCDNYKHSSVKSCNIGKHMFCYLTGQKTPGSSNNYCDINGNINEGWQIKASRAWCEVRCING